jgi:hypothetical protein
MILVCGDADKSDMIGDADKPNMIGDAVNFVNRVIPVANLSLENNFSLCWQNVLCAPVPFFASSDS